MAIETRELVQNPSEWKVNTGLPAELPFGLNFEELAKTLDDGQIVIDDGKVVRTYASGPCGGTTTCDLSGTTLFGLDQDLTFDGE